MSKRGILTLKYPMEHGIVSNWDDLRENLASYLLQRVACSPRGTPSSVDRGPAHPQNQQRKDDTDHV